MPIIYSNYKKTNNGFNIGGQEVGFIGEIPFGIQYFETLKAWEKLVRDCGLMSYNIPEEDLVGESSYKSVIAQDVVGNGATYITFLGYTDADLPDNYEIEAEFYYETTSTVGLYGFDAQTGNRTFLVTTSGSFISRFYEAQVTATLTPTIGQRYKVKSVVSPTEYEFFVDGVSYGTVGYIKNISNKPIELLTLGEMLLPATHNLISFKITDIDTGEYLQLTNEERQSDGITLLKKYDAQGNFIENIMGEQFFSPAIPTVDNNFRRSEANEKGVSIAKALGNQLLDKNRSQVGVYYSSTGTLTSEPNSFAFLYYIKVKEGDVITSNNGVTGAVLHIEYDKDKNVIQRVADQTYTVPQGVYYIRTSFYQVMPTYTIENAQCNYGAVSLPYESWQGYYIDEALQYPYQDGTPITADSKGLLTAWIDNGQGVGIRPSVDARGPIKMDMDIVNGVISEIITVTDTEVTTENIGGIDYYSINVTNTGGLNQNAVISATWLNNTQYTFNIDAYELLDTTNIRLRVIYTDASAQDLFFATETEQNFVVTTQPSKTIEKITIVFSNIGILKIKKDTFYCYEGTSIPLGQPSGIYESGNSIISADIYGKRNNADTNEILRNPDGTPKLIAYDDMANITYQQMYVSEDKQKILFFEEPIVRHSTCDSKTRKLLKMNEQYFVQTAEGSGEYEPYLVDDGTGSKVPFNVLKEWVEVIE